MDNSNADLIQRGYQAFGAGDLDTVLGILDPEVAWHVPGHSPLSGDYKGHDQVVGFFGRTMELSENTFTIALDAVLADAERVVVLCTVAAERGGHRWTSPEVHVWRVIAGHAIDFREFQGDQEAEDRFWTD